MKGRLALLVVLLLVACQSAQGPVDVVRDFMQALETFDLDRAEQLVCARQKSKVQEGLRPFSDGAYLEAFDLKFDALTLQEISNDGERAVVHVQGSLTLVFLGQEDKQTVNEDHIVIKEGGRWVICDP